MEAIQRGVADAENAGRYHRSFTVTACHMLVVNRILLERREWM